MLQYLKRALCATLIISVIFTVSFTVSAENSKNKEAADLTSTMNITLSGGQGKGHITDGSIYTYTVFHAGETITLSSEEKIGGVYIMWNKIPGEWTYSIGGKNYTGGKKGFLHEYIPLETASGEVVITIPEGGAQITDIYAFSEGTLPDWVQVWDTPCEEADIMLMPTHADDEQLFFAGILPYYSIERKLNVQVVYLTNHWDATTRPHEQLNGLWTVGIRNYPVIAEFPDDVRSVGDDLFDYDSLIALARRVYNEDEWVKFQVEMFRRFKPQVVIDHDINGEYMHGAHILNTDAVMEAVKLSNDPSYDSESADKYGLWDVPKLYLHMYKENPIVMDWDTPYESMGGRTPFEMTKLGYACHYSQQHWWFTGWLNMDKATDITRYSPCDYGLYRSTVGEDIAKNDFMENITPYAVQAAQKEEERLKQEEEERLKREEEERLKQEEEERRRQEEESRLNQQNSSNTEQSNTGSNVSLPVLIAIGGLLLVLIVIILIMMFRKRKKSHYR